MDVQQKRNIKPFNGERYAIWKFRVKALLSELGVLKVINEDVQENPSDEWQKQNLTAKNTIIEYLSDAFLNFANNQTIREKHLRKFRYNL